MDTTAFAISTVVVAVLGVMLALLRLTFALAAKRFSATNPVSAATRRYPYSPARRVQLEAAMDLSEERDRNSTMEVDQTILDALAKTEKGRIEYLSTQRLYPHTDLSPSPRRPLRLSLGEEGQSLSRNVPSDQSLRRTSLDATTTSTSQLLQTTPASDLPLLVLSEQRHCQTRMHHREKIVTLEARKREQEIRNSLVKRQAALSTSIEQSLQTIHQTRQNRDRQLAQELESKTAVMEANLRRLSDHFKQQSLSAHTKSTAIQAQQFLKDATNQITAILDALATHTPSKTQELVTSLQLTLSQLKGFSGKLSIDPTQHELSSIMQDSQKLLQKAVANYAEFQQSVVKAAADAEAEAKAEMVQRATAVKAEEDRQAKEEADRLALTVCTRNTPPRTVPAEISTKSMNRHSATNLYETHRNIIALERTRILAFEADQALANDRRKIKLNMNKILNQLTAEAKDNSLRQIKEIFAYVSKSGNDDLVIFARNTFSQSLLDVASKQVCNDDGDWPTLTPLAFLVVGSALQETAVMDTFLGQLFVLCPYAAPEFIDRAEGQSKEDYLRTLGYRQQDDVLEDEIRFLSRVRILMALYASVIATPVPTGLKHPHGPSCGWVWFAKMLNHTPWRASVVALNEFLHVAGATLESHYGRQFHKAMTLLLHHVVKLFPKDCEAHVSRFNTLMDKYRSRRSFRR